MSEVDKIRVLKPFRSGGKPRKEKDELIIGTDISKKDARAMVAGKLAEYVEPAKGKAKQKADDE